MSKLSLLQLEEFDPKHKRSRYCCPLCGSNKSTEDKHRSLWVDKKTGVWFCHRCNNKGLLLEWQNQSDSFSSTHYKQHLPNPNPNPTYSNSNFHQAKQVDEKKLKQVREDYQSFVRCFSYSPAQDYLSSRGINAELAKGSGCGFGLWKHWQEQPNGTFTCLKDKRVCFPVRNQSNEIVAMSARVIGKDGLDPTHTVRGYKALGVFSTPRALESNLLVITESPIDALSLATAELPAIATIGTSWPDWLVELASKKQHTLIAFDNDDAGNLASLRLADQISNINSSARVSRMLPSRNDWNKILTTDGLECLKSEVNSFISSDYLLTSQLSTSYDNCNITY